MPRSAAVSLHDLPPAPPLLQITFDVHAHTSGDVQLLRFDVLYALIDALTERMVELLEPIERERSLGEAVVRARFPIPRIGVVAGCRVMKGKVTRHSHVRVRRAHEVVFSGRVGSLRKVDEDVVEVGEGHECGVLLAGFSDVQPDDVLEAFELERLRPTLES